MLSLNDIYKNNEIFYYCNACGEINIPDTDPLSYHESDEMPLKERNLYENYWDEGRGAYKMYVVKYKGNAAMALNFVFDRYYFGEFLCKDEASDEDMAMLYEAIVDYAKMLKNSGMMTFCEVLVGENTDSDGHEIIVIVPYERRSKLEEIGGCLDDIYSAVEGLI